MAYENTLEQFYNSCPNPVQQVLDAIGFNKVMEWLKWVAGDPQALASYGPKYVDLGNDVDRVSKEIAQITQSIHQWHGDSFETFRAKTTDFSQKVEKVGQAIAGTDEVLQACAQGAMEVANTIIDIVKMVIEFLLGSLAVSAALAVFTFGASVAAWVAANIAKGAQAVAKIVQCIEKFARFLERIARIFNKIAEVLKKIAEIIRVIREVFAFLKTIKIGDGIIAFGLAKGAGAAISAPTTAAANAVLPGTPMPGGVGEAKQAGKDAGDAMDAAGNARAAAERHRPPI